MGYTIATLQKNPKSKEVCVGVFFLGQDNTGGPRVYVQTKAGAFPYKATMVTSNGDVVLSNCEAFLRELERQTKMSQITYYYTEDEDRAAEYLATLAGG